MDRKRFLEILDKYLEGRAAPEEEKVVDAWYERMARSGVDGLEGEDEDALEQRYLSIIKKRIGKRAGEYRIVPWRSLAIAATIIFALAASFAIWLGIVNKKEHNISPLASTESSDLVWESVSNSGKEPYRFVLPDGSTILLEPKSEVRFVAGFRGEERFVSLEGEAFFDVRPDPNKPFVVHARELTTKVLGTSFYVRAFKDDKDVAVSVRTGKVFVTTSSLDGNDIPKEEVVLTPNQKVVYDKVHQKLARAIVETPEMILPYEEVRKMRFDEAPVPEIFKAIEKVYGVELVFDSTIYQSCTLTSVISDGVLFDRLNIICQAIGARYTLEENRILIEGSTCNTE